MIYNEETAVTVSDFLLQIKAIKLNNNNPFTWASGLRSPIYCDNRVTLSYPKVRTYMRQQFVKAIQENFGDVDAIVGVATGGIAQGALIAQELGLPFAYVRSASKITFDNILVYQNLIVFETSCIQYSNPATIPVHASSSIQN